MLIYNDDKFRKIPLDRGVPEKIRKCGYNLDPQYHIRNIYKGEVTTACK